MGQWSVWSATGPGPILSGGRQRLVRLVRVVLRTTTRTSQTHPARWRPRGEWSAERWTTHSVLGVEMMAVQIGRKTLGVDAMKAGEMGEVGENLEERLRRDTDWIELELLQLAELICETFGVELPPREDGE